MIDLPPPDEVAAWEPGSTDEGLDPYYNRLYRAYRTLWDRNKELEEDTAYHEKALRKITRRQGRFSLVHHEHAENTIEDMAAVAEAAIRGDEWDD